jgi:hypothetical protein
LDIIICKDLLKVEEISEGKELLYEIVSMLVGLIKNNSDRVFEPEQIYNDSNK